MGWPTLLLMAVALATDAFAVSLANGLLLAGRGIRPLLRMAGCFGLFQGLMPLIGYAAAMTFAAAIQAVDHWVAFGPLAFVCGKMLWDVCHDGEEEHCDDPARWKNVLLLSVATSIDALAVGISIAMMNKTGVLALPFGYLISAGVIAVITFGLCMIGLFVGRKAGDVLGKRAEIVGGIVLIGIGVKILLEHTVFAN